MAKLQKFDLIVIGSGAGLDVASAASENGLKTAVIEKGPLGGTCLNRGCIPSKMLIHSADVIETINNAKAFGIKVNGYKADFSYIIKRTNDTVDKDSAQIERSLRRSKNPVLFKESCEFVGKKVIRVGNNEITAKKILIAAGSRPTIPDIPGLNGSGFVTSTEALRLDKQPKTLTIIGGGYIAAELAHFYGSLGTKINIIHHNDLLINREDEEVASRFTKIARLKYNIYTNSEPINVSKKNKIITVKIKNRANNKTDTLESDALLVAVGVTPNSDTLNLNKTGVKTDAKGNVIANGYLETNVNGIYALGDLVGHYLFRHSANLEAEIAYTNIFGSAKVLVDYTAMPHAIFSSPQIGSVGLTEQKLKEDGKDYIVGKEEYINTAKGMAIEDRTGFVKFLVDRRTKKILGCHILGTDASTLIHEAIVAMKSGKGTIDNITNAVHVHPALSEVVARAAYNAR